jgi:hypothetical protein
MARNSSYVGLDSRLMAVPINLPSAGKPFDVGKPAALAVTGITGGAVPGAQKHEYAVSHDGQRFLINTTSGEAAASPITVILNWKPPAGK